MNTTAVAALTSRQLHDRAARLRAGRARRLLLWGLLLALLAVAQTLLVWLTLRHEASLAHAAAEGAASEAATAVRQDLLRLTQALQTMSGMTPSQPQARAAAAEILRQHGALRQIEWRDDQGALATSVQAPLEPPLFVRILRTEVAGEVELACRAARLNASPAASRSYFLPLDEGTGLEVMDLCVPVQRDGRPAGFVVGTVALPTLLESAMARFSELQRYELSFVEADGARLARAGARRGAAVHQAEQSVDLPGASLLVRADSHAGAPSLLPNLTLALVLGLSLALFAVVLLLARDVRRRARAEQALADALRFRRAMEDSLSTGLRARDLDGAVTYVNPAFCAMVGYSAEELRAVRPPTPPPYWPPERAAEYAQRQRRRLALPASTQEQREGFETLFMRKNGERFPAMVYEAPLLDAEGRQSGWMGAVLDLTAQRRIEDLARQQQERLQASARLATVGEMASLLSHELNQPLAAIASYATGSINVLDDLPAVDSANGEDGAHGAQGVAPLLRQALTHIAEQAERAGRVIKSVHDFVRRREQARETLGADVLLQAVLPLVRMQARKSATQVELALPAPPARMPRVVCDRTMVEQVLLNLARNGIQAMEGETPAAARRLILRAEEDGAQSGRVRFEVQDGGHGITAEVARRLFTPFFTTRSEGMGLGLSLCRTVVEQHGGTLEYGPAAPGPGTVFRFTLPAARPAQPVADPATDPATEAAADVRAQQAQAVHESGDTDGRAP